MRRSLTSAFLILSFPIATGGTIAENRFDGSTTSLDATTVVSGASASAVGRSAFVDSGANFGNSSVSNPAGGRAVFLTDNAAGVFADNADGEGPLPGNSISASYFTITITPGVTPLNFGGFQFDYQYGRDSSGDGIESVRATFSLRSSIDGFSASSQIGSTNTPFNSDVYHTSPLFDLSGAQYQNVSGPVEFRIYVSDNSGVKRAFRLDNIVIYDAVPEPSAAALAALGMLATWRRRRA